MYSILRYLDHIPLSRYLVFLQRFELLSTRESNNLKPDPLVAVCNQVLISRSANYIFYLYQTYEVRNRAIHPYGYDFPIQIRYLQRQGAAEVWCGPLEQAELYHQQLQAEGLTMAPLERC